MTLAYFAPLAAALACLTILGLMGGAGPWDPLMVVVFFAGKALWFGCLACLLDWVAKRIESRYAPGASGGVPPEAGLAHPRPRPRRAVS